MTSDGVTTTPLSGQPDIIGGTNATTDALLQAGVEDIYARFLSLVSTARKIPLEKVSEIAQGRVWDGGTARQLGLVDAFGSLDEAVAEAARLAKISPDNVSRVYLKKHQSFLASLLGDDFGVKAPVHADLFTRTQHQQQALLIAGLTDARALLDGPAIQARCLECPPASNVQTRRSASSLSLVDRIVSWLI